MDSAFYACTHLNITSTDVPDLSLVTSMNGMFMNCNTLNGPANINSWNTTSVTNMLALFKSASLFNQSISNWNTSNVTNMSYMLGASLFNQPIYAWNTSNVTKMTGMFDYASSFNQPIDDWNVTNVTDMQFMFSNAKSFNQSLNSWNTSKVKAMTGMFNSASSFNQRIDDWDVSNVSDMAFMFLNASSFNQPIVNWEPSSVSNMLSMFSNANSFNQSIGKWRISVSSITMENMFAGDTLCTKIYDDILINWASRNPYYTRVKFDAGGSKYSAASAAARATLINKGWTIKDEGLDDGTSVNPKCLPTEIEESLQTSTSIQIYPNPSNGQFVITSEKPIGNIAVYNAVGALIYQSNTSTTSRQNIDLKNQSEGIYFIKIGNESHKVVLSF
jgi:surface protein